MIANPTKEEIDALEREVNKVRKQRIRRAVNPRHQYAG